MRGATKQVNRTKEIKDYQEKITWIKTNLSDQHSPVYDIYTSSSPKRDLIIKWAEYLEKLAELGAYQKPVSTISTHIQDELRAIGMAGTLSYVREILPFKYKDATKDHSEEEYNRAAQQRENSSKILKGQFKEYAKRLKQSNKLNELYIKKLQKFKTNPKLPPPEAIDPAKLEEIFLLWDNSLASLREALDGRVEVFVTKQYLYYFAFNKTTQGWSYDLYVNNIRQWGKLTGKQASKLLSGEQRRMHILIEPKNRDNALNSGYYGFPCQQCGSWRVKYKWNGKINDYRLFCFNCLTWSPVKTVKLEKQHVH